MARTESIARQEGVAEELTVSPGVRGTATDLNYPLRRPPLWLDLAVTTTNPNSTSDFTGNMYWGRSVLPLQANGAREAGPVRLVIDGSTATGYWMPFLNAGEPPTSHTLTPVTVDTETGAITSGSVVRAWWCETVKAAGGDAPTGMYVAFTSPASSALELVRLVADGGTDGSDTAKPSYTYGSLTDIITGATVSNADGSAPAGLSPFAQRTTGNFLSGTVGLTYRDLSGNVLLFWVDEVPKICTLSGYTGTASGGTFTVASGIITNWVP